MNEVTVNVGRAINDNRDDMSIAAIAALSAVQDAAEKIFAENRCTFRDIEGFRAVVKLMVED